MNMGIGRVGVASVFLSLALSGGAEGTRAAAEQSQGAAAPSVRYSDRGDILDPPSLDELVELQRLWSWMTDPNRGWERVVGFGGRTGRVIIRPGDGFETTDRSPAAAPRELRIFQHSIPIRPPLTDAQRARLRHAFMNVEHSLIPLIGQDGIDEYGMDSHVNGLLEDEIRDAEDSGRSQNASKFRGILKALSDAHSSSYRIHRAFRRPWEIQTDEEMLREAQNAITKLREAVLSLDRGFEPVFGFDPVRHISEPLRNLQVQLARELLSIPVQSNR